MVRPGLNYVSALKCDSVEPFVPVCVFKAKINIYGLTAETVVAGSAPKYNWRGLSSFHSVCISCNRQMSHMLTLINRFGSFDVVLYVQKQTPAQMSSTVTL